MDTEITKIYIEDFLIIQRKSDGYLDGNHFLNQWCKRKNMKEGRMIRFLRYKSTISIVNYIYKCSGKYPYEIIKGVNTSHGRKLHKVYMHIDLFMELVRWMDIRLYSIIKNKFISMGIINRELKVDYERDEVSALRNIELAINVSCHEDYNIYYQYICCDGKYRLDMLLKRSYDAFGHKTDDYIIIEYDEIQHSTRCNIIKDSIRERDVCKCLSDKSIHNNRVPIVSILRIDKGREGFLYAYAIPYIIGMDTSTSYEMMVKNMDFRVLYDWFKENGYQ